ncbi:udp-glucose 6-dehydrogenase : Nucleotide sugar dehydrogenase OS=Isosphaera pallida (strain ATCC 43644 / DSM 9630 / IS1B) GN=Isop_0060 PE=3 SV=1: UDPG_MGDP_dh_N: UDPG_MGDP_dh: UDPG_MGDP_dh_C [Gemmataceae bacterium]|nr:udp-glucose 6-dehydrogenase : Nucleotide sugar dehydrogenase OS=Isosphaera pallida (strain ATCC 43644 / DSM 9630 / IS1B) GN=Isop_0060 PE=3 SV=1: UDPG_MGDP_dh_N: UDPG_MGDP_dh: UDPG_MGDP_dh_C [Gemmataceae bacterium]VTT98418.1 udp-glucose 6-dehydrogenase : Nucleotide sugar dehydrogenase OS=Isosphaera pallida (strain ATCC 43644 / DSM 9630 / IS1B) GN=Isop_0060 PE=3 SV=1: UDPG_MGDP_dh_N: UDPG_MGDP_dh: UDPG_MGDP_dh_C [Gemmataceae bacterium]
MKVAVIGTGYVGLVTGTCLAESGNDVACVDNNAAKVQVLNDNRIPIYEPGLLELVQRNKREGRLTFTTDLVAAVRAARLIFIAVGTPQSEEGDADLTAVFAVADAIGEALKSLPPGKPGDRVVITKSTVPVGTNAAVAARLAAKGCGHVDVASNPEFLKEGAAIEDFMKPDRVVVGVRSPEVGEVLRELYAPFLRTERPFLVMTPESAEMTKYAANAMLATKISFINEMANLCDRLGADINDVRKGIGHDQRIGFQFLFPGPGYGGSCFPKDVEAIVAMGRRTGLPLRLMQAVDAVNDAQKEVLFQKVWAHFSGQLTGKTLAVWGLAFKPRTDDVREAPALTLVNALLAAGASVRVHDPEAMGNIREIYGDKLHYADRPYGALEGADGLVIVTEWQEFRNPDFEVIRRLLKDRVIFDGRNIYEPRNMAALGFTYYGIGRGSK